MIVARIFLGERINRRTAGSIAMAFMGLVIMVVGDLEVGNIVGDLAALSAAVGFACYTAIVRSAPHRDWAPVLPGYAVLMIVICGVVTIANGKSLVPPAYDVTLALFHGGLFIVGGTLLYNNASRSVPAAAMTVFAQTEMVLVPLWAFLVLAERPETPTLIGGTIIMLAVVGKAVLDARERTPSPPRQRSSPADAPTGSPWRSTTANTKSSSPSASLRSSYSGRENRIAITTSRLGTYTTRTSPPSWKA